MIDPLGTDTWVALEVGGGGQLFFPGVNGGAGVVFNPSTRQMCFYTKVCYRAGGGVYLGGGVKVGATFAGPPDGHNLGGVSFEAGLDIATPDGGGGGSVGVSRNPDGNSNISGGVAIPKLGLDIGYGVSAGLDICYTKVYGCLNPIDCIKSMPPGAFNAHD